MDPYVSTLSRARPRGAVLLLALLPVLPVPAEDGDVLPSPPGRYLMPANRAVLPGEANPDVARCLKLARDSAAARNWPEAARAYGELLQTYYPDGKNPGAVVHLGGEVYAGAAELALREIAALPPEGRAACRAWAEPFVRPLLAAAVAAREDDALWTLLDRYPFSDAAGRAAALLARHALSSGGSGEIAAVADRAARLPAEAMPPAGAALLVSALSVARDRVRLAALVERLNRDPALRGARVLVAGREVPLAGFADEQLAGLPAPPAAPAAAPAPEDGTGWPQFGGNAAHLRWMTPIVDPLRPIATLPLHVAWLEGFQEDLGALQADLPIPPTCFPAIADGFCYLASDRSVTSFPLDPPAEPAGAAASKSREPAWRFELPLLGGYRADDRAFHAATVHRGRVLAAMVAAVTKAEHHSFIYVKYPFPKRALVALDAWTGRLLWRTGGALEGSDDARLSYALPPTPDGDLLYAGATLQPNATDPFAHYVVCLDAATGRLRWKTFVSQGLHEVNLFNNHIRDSMGTAVTVRGDTLYYGTNLGCVAALDRVTGRIRWIRKYDQVRIDPPKNIYTQPLPLRWANNPPVVAAETLVVTPLDAFDAFGFDAATGELRWRLPWGGEHGEMWRYVLGARGNLLYVSGRELMAIDLGAGGRRRWSFAPPPPQSGAGRGGVTPNEILFPTDRGLHRVDPASGQALAYRPWARPEQEAGHVVSADGVLIATSLRSASVYDMPAALRAFGEEALERDPGNLLLRYRAGARALAAGRPEDGMRHLREALKRAEARPGDDEAERVAWLCRRQLARQLSDDALRAAREEPDRARTLFDEARRLADDPAAARDLALRFGEALRNGRHAAAALAVLQETVLEAPPAAGDEGAGGDTARDQAARTVEAILAAAGREPYAPHEAKARAALDAARRDPSLARFAAVGRAWPNSLAAREAGLEILALHEKAGAWEPLAAAARAFLRDHGEAPEAPSAARALVAALENRGQAGEAKRVLRQMGARWKGRPVRVDGREVPAEAWADERLRLPRYQRIPDARGAPDLPAPLQPAWTYAGAPAAVRPGGAPAAPFLLRQTRLLAFPGSEDLPPAGLLLLASDRTLRALDLPTGNVLWERTLPALPRAAAAVDEVLLVLTDAAATGLRTRTGEVLWQYESRTPFHRHGPAGGLYLLAAADPQVAGRSRVTALDPAAGRVAWTTDVPGLPVSDLFAYADHVAFVTTPPGQVVSLDATTGQVEQVTPVRPTAFTHGAVFLAPGRIALVGTAEPTDPEARIVCLVPETGQKAWEASMEGRRVSPGVAPAGGAALALVLSAPGGRQQEVTVLDPATGKRVVFCSDLPSPLTAAPVALLTDGTSAYVLFRGRDRNEVTLKAFEKTRATWTFVPPDPGGESVSLAHPPVLTERHVVLPLPRFSLPRGPWLPRVALVDKATGKAAQDLQPGPEAQSQAPPRVDVFNGTLTILTEGSLRVYRNP